MVRERMRWILPVFVVLCAIAALRLRAAPRRPDPASLRDPQVKQAAAVLLATPDRKAHPYEGTRRKKQAIEALKAIGTAEAVDALLLYLESSNSDGYARHNKREALLALGQVGTREAVNALRSFDEWAEDQRAQPAPFRFGYYDPPVAHFSTDPLAPELTASGKAGLRWAAFKMSDPLFRGDWWVTSSADGQTWRSPVWVGMSTRPSSAVRALLQQLAAGEKTLQQLEQDGDADGITDAVEQKLGTDASQADTDRDGIPDGRDGNPLTPRHRPDETTEIRQAVFAAVVGVSNSRTSLLVVDSGEFARQEYYGYSGPILKVPAMRPGCFNLTDLRVTRTSPTTAEVWYADYEGNLAASSGQVIVEKKHGRWVVVRCGPWGVA